MRRRACLLVRVALADGLLPLGVGGVAAGARTVLAATPIARTDLPWWRDRHEAKLHELAQAKPELIFLGDSITQDWERSGPPEWQDFAPVWQRFYGDRHAVNLGFKGDTTASLLWRIRNGEVAGIAPKAAVMLIGANNLGKLHWSAEDTVSRHRRYHQRTAPAAADDEDPAAGRAAVGAVRLDHRDDRADQPDAGGALQGRLVGGVPRPDRACSCATAR